MAAQPVRTAQAAALPAVLPDPGAGRVQRQRLPAGDHRPAVLRSGLSTEQRTLYTNLAPALFILPYFLFSATAGQIAEKLEKSQLIRITTAMEIAIMSLAAVGFLTAEHGRAAGGAVPDRPAVDAVRAGQVFDPAAVLQARGTDRRQRPGRDGHLDLDPARHDLRRADLRARRRARAAWSRRSRSIALAITGNLVSRAIPRAEPARRT